MFSGKSRARGFTLIELLVVVAVIGILISVLFTALSKARGMAHRAGSQSNLKQNTLLYALYAEDNDGWYPYLVTKPIPVTRRIPSNLWSTQQGYGGLAGLYCFEQETQYGTWAYNRPDTAYRWSTANGRWQLSFEERPIMDRYIEDVADYQALQSPADTSDGGEDDETRWPAAPVEDITRYEDVVWHNISYLYVAGLRNTEAASIGLLGDEGNNNDIGGGADGFSDDLSQGTLRNRNPIPELRGYQPIDNHGSSGGNWAFTDGHVEFVVGKDTAHERIFSEIGRKDPPNTLTPRVAEVETID